MHLYIPFSVLRGCTDIVPRLATSKPDGVVSAYENALFSKYPRLYYLYIISFIVILINTCIITLFINILQYFEVEQILCPV